MRLCTCGHRDARHDQLIGGCLACSCGVFEDVKSSIEEEIPALTPGTAEHAEYVAEAQKLAEVDVAVLDEPTVSVEFIQSAEFDEMVRKLVQSGSLVLPGVIPDRPEPPTTPGGVRRAARARSTAARAAPR